MPSATEVQILDDVIELLTRDELTMEQAQAAADEASWSARFVAVPNSDEVAHAIVDDCHPELRELVQRYGEARTPPIRPGMVSRVIEVPKDPKRQYDAVIILSMAGPKSEEVTAVTVRRDPRL